MRDVRCCGAYSCATQPRDGVVLAIWNSPTAAVSDSSSRPWEPRRSRHSVRRIEPLGKLYVELCNVVADAATSPRQSDRGATVSMVEKDRCGGSPSAHERVKAVAAEGLARRLLVWLPTYFCALLLAFC